MERLFDCVRRRRRRRRRLRFPALVHDTQSRSFWSTCTSARFWLKIRRFQCCCRSRSGTSAPLTYVRGEVHLDACELCSTCTCRISSMSWCGSAWGNPPCHVMHERFQKRGNLRAMKATSGRKRCTPSPRRVNASRYRVLSAVACDFCPCRISDQRFRCLVRVQPMMHKGAGCVRQGLYNAKPTA